MIVRNQLMKSGVGRHFDEMTIYRAAHAFEQAGDWKKM